MTQVSPAEAVFFAALTKVDPAERAAYLDEACGTDADLRRQVERLLAAHPQVGSFLQEDPAAQPSPLGGVGRQVRGGATIDAPVTERTGTVIGPYKLLQQIGEGGMGTVYMAEQTQPVQRKVALKVIKPGMDSRQVIARFEAERQALALMDHVNIARVFDGGTTEAGRPYFVMELVHGVPITKYCDDNHLTPRERLELFIPVCQAIQHAHQKGIIHRDIKPSNVMITLYDGKPVPKVIDFGVAKATEQKLTEQTLFTQYGTMVGTFEYMSPEQAEMSALGVDTRSDIYSLGVLLYELLTGSTPLTRKQLKEAAYAEILRLIKEEEPQKPSTRLSASGEALASIAAQRKTEPAKLSKLMRGELDWIVMKTLEKDRSRRYETANGLAHDIENFLHDDPVLACPPSARYRFRKFARRNRAALAFTGLVALILLTVTGGIGWNLRDRAARQAAVEREVNLALREAEQLQDQTRWPEALSATRRAEGVLAGSGSNELRERVRRLRKDLEMILRLEDIRLLASEWKADKFDLETADRAYAKAFADYGLDVAALPTDDTARRIRERAGVAVALAAALDDWAVIRAASGNKKDKAGSLALTALAQSADSDPWRRQVRQAVQQEDTKALAVLAASPEFFRQPPTSLLALARGMRARGEVDGAIDVLRRAQGPYPGDFWINFQLATALAKLGPSYGDEVIAFNRAALALRPQSTAAHNNLGYALYNQRQLDDAIACYRRAIDLDPTMVRAHVNLGNALTAQGKLDEAIVAGRKAIELNPNSADAYDNLGHTLDKRGRPDEAIGWYRKAIELDPKSANARTDLGRALRRQGKLEAAIASYREAIEIDEAFVGAHIGLGALLCDELGEYVKAEACFRKAIQLDPSSTTAHVNLGNALQAQTRLDEAIAAYRKAIKLDPKFVDAYRSLGCVLRRQGKYEDAIAYFHNALEIDDTFVKGHIDLGALLCDNLRQYEKAEACFRKAIQLDPQSTTAHVNLGNALRAQGKLDDAIAAYRAALKLDSKLVVGHFNLGVALMAQRKLDDAIGCYRRAIELDPKFVGAHVNLGNALFDQKKLEEAIKALKQAIKLAPNLAMAHNNLGNVLMAQGKQGEAIECYRRAIELAPKMACAHNNLGWALQAQDNLDKAIACYRKALEIDPKQLLARNNLASALGMAAWSLVNCPDLKLRDPKRAVELGREAIELAPQSALAWRYAGWVQYRAGNWIASIEALGKSCKLAIGGDCGQWIVMSLAHGKLANEKGLPEQERAQHKAEARRWYERAIKQIDGHPGLHDSFGQAIRAFRAEAGRLFDVKDKQR